MRLIPHQRSKETRLLRLWPLGLALTFALVAAVVVAAAVFYAGWNLLGVQGVKHEQRVGPKTLFDLVKISFGVVAGAGALVALVVAYRKQRVNEADSLRETTRLHTERFTQAVSQLGEESPAVRLGGVHALAGLADDAPTRDLRQTCIDVLCAYLRLPYRAEVDLPERDADARHAYLALREVRHTVIRLISDHLRLGSDDPHSWQGHDLDFTNVVFDGGDFSGAWFSGGKVDFRGARFSGGKVDFRRARFCGGKVYFGGAEFAGAKVDFGGARFSGGRVDFRRAEFDSSHVRFDHGHFYGGRVDFGGAEFAGGRVSFFRGFFDGGDVNFGRAEFAGGRVSFRQARFTGHSDIKFEYACFSSGRVDFGFAEFEGGRVDFSRAEFAGGTVDFGRAAFAGGGVIFWLATGTAPNGLPSRLADYFRTS